MLSPDPPDVDLKNNSRREELIKRLNMLQERVARQERKIARCSEIERSLRESEEKYRFLVENSKDIIWKIDLQDRWTFVSSNAEKVVSYKPEEVIGKKIWDYIAPGCFQMVKEKLEQRIRGEEIPPYEVEIIHKDGRYVPFEVLTAPIVDNKGKLVGIQGISRDISYRKQAEERLKKYREELETRVKERTSELLETNMLLKEEINERMKAEERMRLTQFAVDTCMDSSIWVNSGGGLIYVNDVACQNLGYSREELLSMRVWDIDPTISRPRFHEKFAALKVTGALKFESVHRRKDGSTFPVEVSSNYLKYEDREYEVTFDRDITVRKRNEQEVFDAKEQAELYLDLMSHDINNLNHVALGFLELADDAIGSGGTLDADNRVLIEKPMASLKSSSGLIDKVMKLRKLRSKELRLEQVDICGVLARMKDRYSRVPGRDVTINYVSPAKCMVVANELIDEIFINIIENSLKHSPPDRPLVIDIQQSMACENGKEFILVSIEDNGPGIPDEVKEKLFARFYRGPTFAKGKGLGLYLVKTLVENFSGRVRAEDRVPGDHTKGCRFVVSLPVLKDMANPAETF